MDLRNATYNDLSFMAFGEAQTVKAEIDELYVKLDALEAEKTQKKVSCTCDNCVSKVICHG